MEFEYIILSLEFQISSKDSNVRYKINKLIMAYPRSDSSFTVSRSNWNLEFLLLFFFSWFLFLLLLLFVCLFDFEGGKPETPAKNPLSKDENQQQTQPTYGVNSGIRTRATLVGYTKNCKIQRCETLDKI